MEHLDPSEIARFFRGQLPPERSEAVNRHLATCQPCAARVSQAQGATEAPAAEEASYVTGAAFATPERAPESPPEPAKPRWAQEGRAPDRGEQVGRYLILERVGQGGMGIVYAAWDPELGRRVAIKLLRTDKQHAEGRTVGQARLQREAQAMARLNHPNVISVYDVGTVGEGVFVAMEFVEGTTLKKWVKEKPRSWSEVLDTFLEAGRGLAGAHAAGLVHRDFKPDNVLMGKDGRVRVTDFGLAREAGDEDDPALITLPPGEVPDESPGLAQLTQQGHAVGTLMFMSPEQRRGEAPDARADQFSFCVALYWALYGAWPFDRQRSSQRGPESGPGSSHKGTSRPSDRANDPRPVDPTTGAFEPPRDAKVPAFLRQAIMRGLSPQPKDRFPSMEALLSRLEYRPRRMRWVAAAASLTLVAAVGGYAWLAHQATERHALLCTGAEQKLVGLWDDAVRQRISGALLATGKPEAAEMGSRVTHLLDDYTRRWVEASTEACRATRLRGEQTEALLSVRVVCLERRLQDVKAVTGVLSTVDVELLPKAADTVALLPSLASCADVASMSQVEPRPESPQAQAEIERISGQIAQLKALIDAGRYKQGKEVGEQALKAAAALGYRPLEAEALLWHGVLEVRAGEPEAAEQHLVQSFRTALASRDDEVLTRAAAMLVFAISSDLKRKDDALQWSEVAKAGLARMGGNEELEAELLNYVGVMYSRNSQYPEALAALQRSLQLTEKVLGVDHVRRASLLGSLGNVYRRAGRSEEAIRVILEAIALRERVSGPTHPLTGILHYSLAQTFTRLNQLDQAERHAKRALEIYTAAYGPEHSETSTAYDLLGEVYLTKDQYPEAREAYQKGLELKEKTLGKDHAFVTYSAAGLGLSYLQLGDAARALPLFTRVLALSADPRTRGDSYYAQARALQSLGRKREEVLAAARSSVAAYKSVEEDEVAAEVESWIAKHSGAKASPRTARSP